MTDKAWVLARNRQQFLAWCREQGLNPHDRDQVRYVSRMESVRHLRGARFVLVDGWEGNPAYHPVTQTVAILTHCGNMSQG